MALGAVILLFGLRGLFRGVVSQIFALLGLGAGLWVAGWVSQSVGHHWTEARPAALFWVLRWIVVVVSALAVSSLFAWIGHRLGEATREGPAGWLDRPLGLVVGLTLGCVVSALLVLTLMRPLWPDALSERVARARLAPPLLGQAARACEAAARFTPGAGWLAERFRSAEAEARARRPVPDEVVHRGGRPPA